MSGLGVDVHPYYQRGARFDGVDYAWLKMTDGAAVYTKKVGGVWYTADEHARLLRQQHTPFGGYGYAQPGDGAAEARVLWNECQRLGGTGVAPACDIESNKDIHTWSPGEATDHGRAFCSWFRARGIRPAIYMGAAFANTVRPDLWPEDPVIWIARYGAKPEAAGAGHYGGRYNVHQFSSSGTLPGSAGAVDWNQSYTNAHLIGEDMTPQEFLDSKVEWWDGHSVAMKDLLAEVYIAARGLAGKPAFEDQKTPVLLPPLAGLSAKTEAVAAAVAALASEPDMTEEKFTDIINKAVAGQISITGDLHIGPATAAPESSEASA